MYELQQVEFQGDRLDVVQQDDKIWVSVKRVCECIGLDYGTQHRKLASRDQCPWATIRSMTTVAGDGKDRDMNAIDLECLPMWLATVSPAKVKEEAREKLAQYQIKCAQVLRDHFFGTAAPKKDNIIAQMEAMIEVRKAQLVLEQKTEKAQAIAEKAHQVAIAALDTADCNFRRFSVLGFCNLIEKPVDVKDASAHGIRLTKICNSRSLAVSKIKDPRFGQVNTYPQAVLEEYFDKKLADNVLMIA